MIPTLRRAQRRFEELTERLERVVDRIARGELKLGTQGLEQVQREIEDVREALSRLLS